jgi:BarA-like signal transduction histidine kinase
MKLTLDTDAQKLIQEIDGECQTIPLYSKKLLNSFLTTG